MKKRELKGIENRKNVSAEIRKEYVNTLKRMVDCKTVFTSNFENQPEYDKFYKVIEETYNVCKKMNINVLPYNEQLDYEKFVSNSLSSKMYRKKIIKALIKQNGMIRSSAIDDLQNGVTTEIRCLLDCILNYGNSVNADICTLKKLDFMLSEIENGKIRINKYILNNFSF